MLPSITDLLPPHRSNYFPKFYGNDVPAFLCSFATKMYCHIFNRYIFYIVIDSNQDEEDQEEVELEEGNAIHLYSY